MWQQSRHEQMIRGLYPGRPKPAFTVSSAGVAAPSSLSDAQWRTRQLQQKEMRQYAALIGHWELFRRPGWTIIGSQRLRLGYPARTNSGVWAVHNRCGHLQQASINKELVCAGCRDPSPVGYWRHERRLIYLMHGGDDEGGHYLKLGVGGVWRIREHVTNGATIVQVLEGPAAQVNDTETRLKTFHSASILRWCPDHLPGSFGRGYEVMPHVVDIDLEAELDDKEDVAGDYFDYFTLGAETYNG